MVWKCFKTDGAFVREAFLAPRTLLAGSASGLAFSPDQRFLYVIDGANHPSDHGRGYEIVGHLRFVRTEKDSGAAS